MQCLFATCRNRGSVVVYVEHLSATGGERSALRGVAAGTTASKRSVNPGLHLFSLNGRLFRHHSVFLPEKEAITDLRSSDDGAFIVAGAVSGTVSIRHSHNLRTLFTLPLQVSPSV